MSIERIEKFEVRPTNEPSSGYSYKGGNPVITFSLGSVNKFLKPQSLRLHGKFQIKTAGGASLNNASLKQGVTGTDVRINSRVSVDSVFQNITLTSDKTNQSLETVRQYGRLMSTMIPSTLGSQDMFCHQGVTRLATGESGSSGVMLNNQMSFSLKLMAGLLTSSPVISMSANGVNGLGFSFELASDQQVLFGTQAGDSGGCFYTLTDLSLTGDYIVPDPVTQQKMSVPSTGQMPYRSFNSLYSVINSSDSTQTFNLSSSQVLSVFSSFLPVTSSNSYAHDGFETDMLKNKDGSNYTSDVTLKKVSFSRGGLKIGLDYDLDVQTMSSQGLPETGVMVNALNAVQKFSDITHMSNQPLLVGFGQNDPNIYEQGTQSFATVVEGKRNFAIGLHFDRIANTGVSFKSQSFSQRIQSTANGNSPMASFLFYLTNNVLVYSPQGIQILS